MRLLVLLMFLCGAVSAQDTTKYYTSKDYGWQYKRVKIDSSFMLPKDTLKNKLGIAQIGTTIYIWNGTKWISNASDASKLNVSDTALMLSKYLRKADTLNMLNPYLRKADTSTMLSPYLRKADTTSLSNRINAKLSLSDTSTMLTPYLRKADTTNKFVASVTSLNDSTIRVIKGSTTTDIVIKPVTTVTNATRLITTVYNKSGATIPKGSVVYISGAHSSNLPSIDLAKANTEETSAYTYGLVETDISNNSQGTVIQIGLITNLNLPTSTYTDGQTLYLSPTVAGGYTLTKPTAPNHYVAIGTVTRAHPTLGTIQIAIRNGFQLDEMSDVKIALLPLDSTLLQFSRTDSLWHDVSVVNAIGNKYIKPTDTASLSNRINLKVNIADTSTMLAKYLRKTDTSTLSTRINNCLPLTGGTLTSRLTGTSLVLNKDSLPIVSDKKWALVVDTSNSNRISKQIIPNYIDSGWKTWADTITWTGTAAPSGTRNNFYRWSQIGKMVHLEIRLNYATVGTLINQAKTNLPSMMPLPSVPSGWDVSANSILYYSVKNYGNNTTGQGANNFCSILYGGGAASRTDKISMSFSTGAWSKFIYSIDYLTD